MTIDAPGEIPAGETADDRSRRPARNAPARTGAHWFVFVAAALAVLVVDQLTKAWLVASVAPGDVIEVIGDYVRLVFSRNSGALFGLFRDNAALFGLVSLVVVGLIIGYHAKVGQSRYLSIALGLLLGGAIGNLADRLRLGYVVDFVDLGIGDLRFFTFNVGDSAITLAILMLIAAAIVPALSDRTERASDG